jgi:hypothetical protein
MENKQTGAEHAQRDWHPLEYAHVFLWLIKDMCWAQGWKVAGVAMIVPTVLVAYVITWKMRSKTTNLIHNIAVSIWISANSLWMFAEFYGLEHVLKPWASVGFGAGLLILVAFYIHTIVQWKMKRSANKA